MHAIKDVVFSFGDAIFEFENIETKETVRFAVKMQSSTIRDLQENRFCSVDGVASRLGVTSDYVRGIFETLEVRGFCADLMYYRREQFKQNFREIAYSSEIVNFYHPCLDKLIDSDFHEWLQELQRRIAETDEKLSEIEVRKMHARLRKRTRLVCEQYSMPDVPSPACEARKVAKMKSFRGIYFGWDGLFCTYVGKSVNVPSRLGSHTKIQKDQMVSFLRLDEIDFSELFYIWLLRPVDNFNEKFGNTDA